MKKQIIALICVVLIAAAAVTVYCIASDKYGQEVTVGGSEFPDPCITGVAEAEIQHEVEEMTMENVFGTLHFTPKTDEDTTQANRWYIKELGNQLSHIRNVHTVANAFFVSIPYSSAFRVEQSDYDKYGLTEPDAVVSFKMKDGASYKFTFGNSTNLTGDSAGHYMMRDDNGVVYVVEDYYYNLAVYSLSEVISNVVVDTFDESSVLTDFHIYGKETEEVKMSYVEDMRTYHLTEPDDLYLSLTAANDFVLSFNGLESLYVAAADFTAISDELLSFYGFTDNPRAAVTIDYKWYEPVLDADGKAVVDENGAEVTEEKTGTLTLRAGVTSSDPNYTQVIYVMRDDVPIIYAVSPSAVSYWTDFKVDENVSKLLYTKDMYTIDSVSYITAQKTYEFDLDVTTQLDAVRLNGKDIAVSDFRTLYASTVGLQYAERTDADKPAGEEYLRIVVKDIYGNTDTMTYTSAGERRYYATINGKGGKLVSYQPVEELLAAVQSLDKGSLQ